MSIRWEPTSGVGRGVSPIRHFTGELRPLAKTDVAFFEERYEIPSESSRRSIKRAIGSGRYALPIFGPDTQQRGLVLRTPWPGAPVSAVGTWPKADTFKASNEPLQSHYWADHRPEPEHRTPGLSTPLVVVEDQLSAIKLAAYGYDSVAFLGVPDTRAGGYSGADRVMEISRRAKDGPVIIALDSDATEAAFLFARKWGHAFKSIRVAILAKDLKDTPAADFRQVLGDSQ